MYNYRTHLQFYNYIENEEETRDWQVWRWIKIPYYGVMDCACAEAHCEHRVERAIETHKIRRNQWLLGREGPWPFTYDNYAGIEGRRQHWYKYTDDLDWNKKRPCDGRKGPLGGPVEKATPITNIRIIKPRA